MAQRIKTMAQPTQTADWLNFAESLLPYLTIFGLMWKAFDLVFKYFSEKQKQAVRELIHSEVKPDIERLNENFERLEKAIWGLEKSISK